MDDLGQKEKMIDDYAAQGKKEDAVKLIYELVVEHVKMNNFSKAEALRDRIYDIDGMALSEIIRAGEIIEQGKSESRDEGHLKIWEKLYTQLSEEEGNTLYYAMEEASYGPNTTILRQGDQNRKLYFIDQGEARITYEKDGDDHLLKTLGPGDLAGIGTFFSKAAFLTTTLTSLSSIKVNTINNGLLKKWETDFHGLVSKLENYCFSLESVEDLLKKQNMDRRVFKRYPVTQKAVIQMLQSSGKPTGKPFKGTLSDISAGGLSFFIRITKKETARMLLGRLLKLNFDLPVKGKKHPMEKVGRIIGVQFHVFGDHSIHVRFNKIIEFLNK